MDYKIKDFLVVDNSSNGSYDEDLEPGVTLLAATESIHNWDDDHSEYGYRSNSLIPAFRNGQKAWVHSTYWNARSPYSATGGEEAILSFSEGVALLLKMDAFVHLFAV